MPMQQEDYNFKTMNKYYIPVSSLNFNNIFSSESISPASFYDIRGFGYKRFSKVEPNPFDNSILLYSKLPLFSLRDKVNANFPFYIELPENAVNNECPRIKSKDITIIKCDHSIYLSPGFSRIIFLSSSELKNTTVTSEQSLETKLANRYSKNIIVFDKNSIEYFTWSKTYLEDIKDNPVISPKYISFDQSVNKVKGFVYGYLVGALSAKSKEFVELQKLVKEIKNIVSGLINIYSNYSKSVKSNKNKSLSFIPKATYSEIQNRLTDLRLRVDNAKVLLRPYEDNEKEIIDRFLKKYESIIDINILLQILKEIKPTKYSFYEQLEWAMSAKTGGLSLLLNRLLSSVSNLFISDSKKYSQNEFGINEISESLSVLEQNILAIESNILSEKTPISVEDVLFITSMKLSHFPEPIIKEMDQDYFKTIINSLFVQPHESVDGFKQEKTNIIFSIGKEFKNEKPSDIDVKLIAFLNNLMESIDSANKPFNLSDTKSIVWKSFASFFIRGEDPDRLIDYLISQGIEDYRFALGMWGAYFGFANMPKTITNTIFENTSVKYQDSISDYIFSKILMCDTETIPTSPEQQIITPEIPVEIPVTKVEETKVEYGDKINEYLTKFLDANKPKDWSPAFNDHIRNVLNLIFNPPNISGSLDLIEFEQPVTFNFSDFEKKLKNSSPKGFGPAKINIVIEAFKKIID